MLIIQDKTGCGIFSPYNNPSLGHGLLDFVKKIFHKAPGLAARAINSNLGKKAIAGAKQAAKSKLGQELQKTIISEVSQTAQNTAEKALKKIGAPKTFSQGVAQKTQDVTQQAFQKLGIVVPAPVKRKRKKSRGPKAKKSKGQGILGSYNNNRYYPYNQGILGSYNQGYRIIIE